MRMPLPMSASVGKFMSSVQTNIGAILQTEDWTPATAVAEIGPEHAATTGVSAYLAVLSSVVTTTKAASLSSSFAPSCVQAVPVSATLSSNALQNVMLAMS